MLKEPFCFLNLFPALINTKNGALYGYIDSTGKFIIKPQYTNATDFTKDGTAIVSYKDQWGIIDSKGIYLVEPIYSFISSFKDNRAIFSKDNLMGVMDETGKIIPTKAYNFIDDYKDGLSLVSVNTPDNNTLYGYIDNAGNEVIPPKYKIATSFDNGFALIQTQDEVYKIIDKNNKVITTFPYKVMGNLKNNYLTFSDSFNGLIGYVDIYGKVIIPPKFTSAFPVEDNYIIASTANDYIGGYGVFTLDNYLIYPYIYSSINYLGENRFTLGMPRSDDSLFMNNIYALGDEKGIILTKFQFKDLQPFHHSIASASDLKNSYFINLKGQPVKALPIIEGTGTLSLKCELIYANVDYWPMYLSPNGSIIYTPNSNIPLDKQYSILTLKYKPNVNYLIYFPQVKGVTPYNIEATINSKLRDLSDLEKINEKDVLDYDRYGTFNVLFFEKELLSLEINTYNYPFGAAHGLTTRKTPNINLKTGEFYELSALFKGGIYWTKYVDDIITNMIKTDPQYEYVYPDGFKGITLEQGFYVDKNNLYIYFPPYDIAPYSAGFVTFKIPFTEIDPLINKQGSFYKAFN